MKTSIKSNNNYVKIITIDFFRYYNKFYQFPLKEFWVCYANSMKDYSNKRTEYCISKLSKRREYILKK